MDKVLILGAGNYQMPLINVAKREGIEVVVITPEGDYPGIKAADKVYFHDAKDETFALDVGIRESVNGVISDQSELFVRPVAYVAENMGLRGNSYITACLYTNKHLMREKSRASGFPTIDSITTNNIDDALDYYSRLHGSAIIKPVDSFSSHGVSKIEHISDIVEKWDEAVAYSGTGEIIVERFIEGPQFEVDSIAFNGHVRPLMYADLKEFKIPNVFSSSTRLYPSVAEKTIIERLLKFNNKINESFGMQMGVSHNEYIMDKETGEIYLIEASLRGGGTYIASHIAMLETGIDTAEFLVNAALGRIREIPAFEMNQQHAGYACFYLPEGEIVKVDGLEEVNNLEYVAKTRFKGIHVGNITDVIEGKDQRYVVVLSASSRSQILDRIEHIKELINIQVKTDKGLMGPIWE